MQIRARIFFLFLLEMLLCPACCLPGFSQDKPANFIITTRRLTSKDGLAGKQVNCGIQDSKGFIWLGTAHGLQRYDGKNFKLFAQDNGLQVIQLAEDQNHLLWIMYGASGSDRAGIGKVDVLDLDTYTLQNVSQRFGASLPFKEADINMIKANEKNELLVNANYSPGHDVLWSYSKAGGFRQISTGMERNPRNRLYFRGDKVMTLFGDSRIVAISGDRRLDSFQSSVELNLQYIPLGIGPDGSYFIASASRFRKARAKMHPLVVLQITGDGKTHEVSNLFSQADASTIEETISGSFNDPRTSNIILAHDKRGIYLFDGKDYLLLIDSTQLKEYRYPRIYDYFTAGADHHWICTGEGIIEIVVKPNHFTHFLSSDVIKFTSAIYHQSRSIYADSGGIYATCWDGFYRISKSDSDSIEYKRIAGPGITGEGDGFYFDGKYFWMSGLPKWVSRINVALNEIRHYPSEAEHLWAGINTRDGKILIGTPDKLLVPDNDTFKIRHLCNGSDDYHNWFYQLFYSHDGKLWAVSNKGLSTIENGCISAQYSAEATDKRLKIPFTDVHCVFEDKSGNFWMATNGGGLINWDRKKNSFRQFTVSDGLSSNVLYSILEDEHGLFWISSEYGLMRFDPVSHFVKTYTVDDGLTNDEFNRISYFKAADGRMFFGGLNGINAFYPKNFWSDSSKFNMPLRVVSFNQFIGKKGRLIDKTSELTQQNAITLNPGDEFFTMEFQLLDFEEGRHRYAYRIEGIDNEWNYISENSIRLSGLPYGNYTLRVRGQNFEGAWSKNELNFPLSILRPFYTMGWFYFVVGFFLIAIIYLVLHWRTRSLEKANAKLEQIVGKRTLQLQDSLNQKDFLLKEIHHRVKNNLQVISSMLELQAANAESESLKNALTEGQARVRSIALIHHRLYEQESLGAVEFCGFIKDLYKQVAAVFQKEGHEVEFFCDIPDTFFEIDTIVPLGLISNELFTNSFKYAFNNGTKGEIYVTLATHEKGNYLMTYADSGPGLPVVFNSQKTTSLGLRLIYRLGKQLGGHVSYNKSQNTFTINFKDSFTRKQND